MPTVRPSFLARATCAGTAALMAGALGAAPAGAAPASDPVPTPIPAAADAAALGRIARDARPRAAAGYVARQMVRGMYLTTTFNGTVYPNHGQTIDAVFAFAASKSSEAYARRAMMWLAVPGNVTAYTGDGEESAYAGGTAKLALAAAVRGMNASKFGGRDLIAQLRGLQQPSGRFSDKSQFGDYSNVLTQSFAIFALKRTRAGVPASASTFLAEAQCADGGFPQDFGRVTCTSNVDATATALQALRAVGKVTAANKAAAYLVKVQGVDGSFRSGPDANANSTGLAAQALVVSGRIAAANKARQYLARLQVGCAAPADRRGAIAYSAAGFDAGNAPFATAQAVLGLTGAGYATLRSTGSVLAAPTATWCA